MPKRKRKAPAAEELNITSMMDMMTIILVFLLKSFSASEVNVTPTSDLKLPITRSTDEPRVAVSVIVSKREILVDDKPVMNLESVTDPTNGQPLYQIPASEKQGSDIRKLFTAFETAATNAKSVGGIAGERADLGFKGEVSLQIDKDIPFAIVRDVMYNAGQAEFAKFEFITIKAGE
jgi:biopolymer transport protein ExbD